MNTYIIKLSSNVTFVYKYIIPAFFFLATIIVICSFFYNFLNIDLFSRIFIAILLFVFCLFMIPLINLHFISYNENLTIIKGFKETKSVSNKDVIKVKRFMFYFYRVFYFENDKVKKSIFMPHTIGVFFRFWGKPKSIKKYELNISGRVWVE